jgi:phosphoglycolate phosphatase
MLKRGAHLPREKETRMRVDALLFDKDGTLFDFHHTWGPWVGQVIEELAEGDRDRGAALASALGYDLATKKYFPNSPLIACTNRQAAEFITGVLPHRNLGEIEHYLTASAQDVPLAPVVPLDAFLTGLKHRGLKLGVMTNDSEVGARAHLTAAGIVGCFDFIAGFDSGYGAKPDPDPLLAFARALGLDPSRVVMVGDSLHDLVAGRAAGMQTVGVLTGPACRAELAPCADAVLPDIGHLTEWLGNT